MCDKQLAHMQYMQSLSSSGVHCRSLNWKLETPTGILSPARKVAKQTTYQGLCVWKVLGRIIVPSATLNASTVCKSTLGADHWISRGGYVVGFFLKNTLSRKITKNKKKAVTQLSKEKIDCSVGLPQ